MTDESTEKTDEEREGLEAAEEEIEEEPGGGMGPASDMDQAEDVEEENEKEQ